MMRDPGRRRRLMVQYLGNGSSGQEAEDVFGQAEPDWESPAVEAEAMVNAIDLDAVIDRISPLYEVAAELQQEDAIATAFAEFESIFAGSEFEQAGQPR